MSEQTHLYVAFNPENISFHSLKLFFMQYVKTRICKKGGRRLWVKLSHSFSITWLGAFLLILVFWVLFVAQIKMLCCSLISLFEKIQRFVLQSMQKSHCCLLFKSWCSVCTKLNNGAMKVADFEQRLFCHV